MKNSKNDITQSISSSHSHTPTSPIFGKIIKRYQNRKLYDTEQSCYVTLDDIQKMIKSNENIVVIDNKSKKDITAATLTQIIFEAEKKAAKYPPLATLREIIQNANGNLSSFLIKLGVLKTHHLNEEESLLNCEAFVPKTKATLSKKKTPALNHHSPSISQTLEERVAHAALLRAKHNFSESTKETEDPPHLPSSNQSLTN